MQQDGQEENAPNADGATHAPVQPQIPDHELIRCIGVGAFGEVWLARATSLTGAYRAVKIVHRTSLDGNGFVREFSAVQKFEPISRSHPSLVHILHVGENVEAGYFYYVMELADSAHSVDEGVDVAFYEPKTIQSELRRRGRLPVEECLEAALALSAGLVHLHRHGLIHRDIKPANIIFVNGVAKLADIGLVANAETAVTFVGTEGFISPEGPGKPQADIYSLGKVFYEIATGLDRHFFPQLPEGWENQANLKAWRKLNEIIQRACETDATLRYQTAEELHADLLRLRDRRIPALAWKTGAAVLGLCAGLFLFFKWADFLERIARSKRAIIGLTDRESADGFVSFFDGTNLEGWNTPGTNWVCLAGALTRVADGGDVTYEGQRLPDDFDLRFEWKISRGGNSGVIYRPGSGLVEYQILDNANKPLGADPKTWAGSLFGYASEPKDQTKPVGQWNEGRIVCEADRIRHFLNGATVLDTHYNQPEWKEARDRLREGFGTDLNAARGGHLVLRDEGFQVWYRSIRVKALK